jgi:outer membrane protein OmpA-like peptidoglycan-associated protein
MRLTKIELELQMLHKTPAANTAKDALVLAPLLALVLAALPMSARATDVSVKVEPGVAIPLTSPQSEIYGVGGGQSAKLLFGLTPYLDVGPTASFLLLPASEQGATGGTAWAFGAGLRLKRPHDAESFHGISPWLDADALYIRTGPLNRPGFDAAVGLAVPIGESRSFWIGPFVRYMHVIQGERPGFDSSDAKVLTLGVSFEAGPGLERKPEPAVPCPAAPPAEVKTVTKEVYSCPDADQDTVPDNVDHCPEVSGPMDNWGCPNYQKIVVKKDKLELKEKLYFAWDQAKLEDASFPTLDEVVLALKDNKGFRVQIEGHTDSTGGDDHNQTLSEKRAEAVLDYLAAHGISKDRLISKGFASSVPTDTNSTAAGRENNRRVEFVVYFIILNEGSAK